MQEAVRLLWWLTPGVSVSLSLHIFLSFLISEWLKEQFIFPSIMQNISIFITSSWILPSSPSISVHILVDIFILVALFGSS